MDDPIAMDESAEEKYDDVGPDAPNSDQNNNIGELTESSDEMETYQPFARNSDAAQAYDQYSIQANSITIKLLSSSVYQLAAGFLLGFVVMSYCLYHVAQVYGTPDQALFDLNVALVTMLCLALINMMRLTLGGGRGRIILLVCGAINTVFCLTYIIESLGITYAVPGSWGRRVQLQHYVEWLFSTPLIIILIGNLTTSAPERYKASTAHGVTASAVEVLFTAPAVGRWSNKDTPEGCIPLRYVVYADVIMLITGALCDLSPFPFNYICLCFSFIAFFITLYGMDTYLRLPTVQMQTVPASLLNKKIDDDDDAGSDSAMSSDDESTSKTEPEFMKTRRNNIRVLNFIRGWVMVTFTLFPCVWMLAATNTVSEHTELWLYFFSDLLAKVGLNAGLHALNSNAVEEASALRERLLQLQLADQIQQAAQTANENRNQFLRYLFHEIRGPLNAVVLGLRDIRTSDTSPDFVDTVGIMSESLNRVSRLLDDANSLYRFDSGHFVLEVSSFSMQRLLFRTLKMLQTQIVGRKAKVRCRIDETLPLIVADKYKIQQVIANLINNAVKFGPYRGRIVITVQVVRDHDKQQQQHQQQQQPQQRQSPLFNGKPLPVRSNIKSADGFSLTRSTLQHTRQLHHTVSSPPMTPADSYRQLTAPPATVGGRHVSEPAIKQSSRATNSLVRTTLDLPAVAADPPSQAQPRPLRINDYLTVRLSVRDQGAGISEEDKQKLFQPYQHVRSGTSQKGNSTGLGLVVSKRIIENLNGRLGVNTALGVGSEFYFEIPAKVAPEDIDELDDEESDDEMDESIQDDTFLGYTDPFRGGKVGKQALAHRVKFSTLNSSASNSSVSNSSASGSDSGASSSHMHAVGGSSDVAPEINYDSNNDMSHAAQSPLPSSYLHPPNTRSSVDSPRPGSNESTPSVVERALSPYIINGSDTSSMHESQSNSQPLTAEMLQSRNASVNSDQSKPYVLIVDDVTSNRTLLSKLLTKQNYICEQASNGQICVDMVLAAPTKYTAILLDHEMPVMNGSTAAKQIRASGNDVTIIGVTGNTLISDQTMFIECGANAILSKPVKLPKLLSAIKQYSARKAGLQTAKRGTSTSDSTVSETTPSSDVLPIDKTPQSINDNSIDVSEQHELHTLEQSSTRSSLEDIPEKVTSRQSSVNDSLKRLQDLTKVD